MPVFNMVIQFPSYPKEYILSEVFSENQIYDKDFTSEMISPKCGFLRVDSYCLTKQSEMDEAM